MTIFENAKVTVKYDSTVPCIVWTPLEYMAGDDWRIPFSKGVDFLVEKIKSTPKLTWLNDARKLKAVSLDDLSWLNKNVNDRCLKYDINKVGFVLPDNIFGKMAVKFYVQYTNARSDNKFQIKTFRSYGDAVNWLMEKSNVKIEEVTL